MKKIIYLLLLLFALNIYGQDEKIIKQYKTYSANIINYNDAQKKTGRNLPVLLSCL